MGFWRSRSCTATTGILLRGFRRHKYVHSLDSATSALAGAAAANPNAGTESKTGKGKNRKSQR